MAFRPFSRQDIIARLGGINGNYDPRKTSFENAGTQDVFAREEHDGGDPIPTSNPRAETGMQVDPKELQKATNEILNNRAAAYASLVNPYVRATLDTIANTEGNVDYNSLNNSVGRRATFSDFSVHPLLDGAHKSNAAGRYQILPDTYREIAGKLGITDFSPESQDLIAAYRMGARPGGDLHNGMAAVREGNLEQALPVLAGGWASIPESSTGTGHYNTAAYGFQRAKPYDQVRALYESHLKKYLP